MSNKKIKEKSKAKLKHADRERSSDVTSDSANNTFFEKYTKARGNVGSVFSKKNKFPIGLDIFISILLIVIVAALVVGAYFLIVSFDDSYENVTVEYVLLVDKGQVDGLQKGNDVYVDKDGSSIHLGNIIEINENVTVGGDPDAAEAYVAIKVRAGVQFRDDEGFSVEGVKIAVGNPITVRVKSSELNSEIVDFTILEVESK